MFHNILLTGGDGATALVLVPGFLIYQFLTEHKFQFEKHLHKYKMLGGYLAFLVFASAK